MGDFRITDADRALLVLFGAGRDANDRGDMLPDNPFPNGSLDADAWAAGWIEGEGPFYSVTAAGRSLIGRRATLADIWPS